MTPGESLKRRRTHGAYGTKAEARQAAFDLGALMNGVPFGYVFFVQKRMGAWVFFSAPADCIGRTP